MKIRKSELKKIIKEVIDEERKYVREKDMIFQVLK